ncbi:MAG TPA: hypothetical protein VGX94_05335 [Terriglobia bacterium]|nr:hypothetical protein [Terriglobia bacterium]
MNKILQIKPTARIVSLSLLACCVAFAAPQTTQRDEAQSSAVTTPSLGELAREAKASRAKQSLKDVPLYTNDNLPTNDSGISVIGPPASAGTTRYGALSAKASLANEQRMAYLRGKLSQLQQHLQLHQREVAVLQQQLNQSRMEWSPNPNEMLRQEYSHQNVNNLASKIDQKKQQIASVQQQIQTLQDELARDQTRFGWLSEASPAGAAASGAEAQVPPGVQPGSPEYWQARIQTAQQQLQTAKEEESLATNELSLLKLQQVRSLDPNTQANLASNIPAKQSEVTAAAQAVEKAQQALDKVEKEAQTVGSKTQ